MSSRPSFLAVDLFCGAGGTTCGLRMAGGAVVAGIDNDAACELTYTANNSSSFEGLRRPLFLCFDLADRSRQQDALATLLPSLADARIRFPDVPLLLAITAPCQPFSTITPAARSKSREQKRLEDGNLLFNSLAFVRALVPDLIFCENVAGISSERHGCVLGRFEDQLREMGYSVGSRVVCASKFGVPQFRKRSITLATKIGDHPAVLPVPDHDPLASQVDVETAIGHLPSIPAGGVHPEIPNHRARDLTLINKRRLSAADPGSSNLALANTQFGNLSLDCHIDAARRAKSPCFTDVYMRMRPDKPSPTITTRCISVSNGRFGHYDPTQLRAITPREAATLQTFPEDYVFYPSHQIEPAARMIGNAVPPLLVRFYANHLISLFTDSRTRSTS